MRNAEGGNVAENVHVPNTTTFSFCHLPPSVFRILHSKFRIRLLVRPHVQIRL